MRLFSIGFAALRFTLALAIILLLSPNTFAQHSGGGSAGGSSGGSHGGSSGGSSSSGSSGSHSSGGGSSSHSSSGHSATGHSSSAGSASPHSGTSHSSSSHSSASHSGTSHSNTARSIHEPSKGMQGKTETSHKHGFFSFLRHHVPKPEPKPTKPKPEPKEPVAELRRPICFRGPCPVCPAGQVHGRNGCGGNVIQNQIERRCQAGEVWTNGGCFQETWYQDECDGLRMMMEQQAQRMQAAEQDRQIYCALGPWQQCSDSTISAASEAGFYRELQNRYQACQRRSPTPLPHSSFRVPDHSAGFSFDPLGLRLSHR